MKSITICTLGSWIVGSGTMLGRLLLAKGFSLLALFVSSFILIHALRRSQVSQGTPILTHQRAEKGQGGPSPESAAHLNDYSLLVSLFRKTPLEGRRPRADAA